MVNNQNHANHLMLSMVLMVNPLTILHHPNHHYGINGQQPTNHSAPSQTLPRHHHIMFF
jgi:hypothetical protein